MSKNLDPASTPSTSRVEVLLTWILRISVLCGLIGTLLGFFHDLHWRLDLFNHFRPHYALGAGVLGGVAWLSRHRKIAALAGVGFAINLSLVAPLYFGHSTPVQPGELALKVVVTNVLTANTAHQKLIDWVVAEQPQVIAVVELGERWKRELDAGLTAWPHRQTLTKEDNFGIGIYSKLPLGEAQWPELSGGGPSSLVTSVQWQDTAIPFVITHPFPPIARWADEMRAAHMQRLVDLASMQADNVVMVGDLNATPWSDGGKVMRATHMRDARKGFGILGTWHAVLPAFLRIPIDYIQVGPGWRVCDCRVGPNIGSDHLPLVAELVLLSESVAIESK